MLSLSLHVGCKNTWGVQKCKRLPPPMLQSKNKYFVSVYRMKAWAVVDGGLSRAGAEPVELHHGAFSPCTVKHTVLSAPVLYGKGRKVSLLFQLHRERLWLRGRSLALPAENSRFSHKYLQSKRAGRGKTFPNGDP